MTQKQYEELLKTNIKLYVMSLNEILNHFAMVAVCQGCNMNEVIKRRDTGMRNAMQLLTESTMNMIAHE